MKRLNIQVRSLSLNLITKVPFLNLLSNPISLTKKIERRIREKALINPPISLSLWCRLQAEMHLNCVKCHPCSFDGIMSTPNPRHYPVGKKRPYLPSYLWGGSRCGATEPGELQSISWGPIFTKGPSPTWKRTVREKDGLPGKAEIPAPRPCFSRTFCTRQ